MIRRNIRREAEGLGSADYNAQTSQTDAAYGVFSRGTNKASDNARTGKRAHRKGDFSSTAKAMASDAEKEMKKLKDQGGDNRTETDGNKSEVDFSELDTRIKQKSKRNATTVWWRLEDMEQNSAKEEFEGVCF